MLIHILKILCPLIIKDHLLDILLVTLFFFYNTTKAESQRTHKVEKKEMKETYGRHLHLV